MDPSYAYFELLPTFKETDIFQNLPKIIIPPK